MSTTIKQLTPKGLYEYKEFATSGQPDSVLANHSMFVKFPYARRAIIKTDIQLSFALNASANDNITLAAGETVEIAYPELDISDIWFKTNNANVKVWLIA